LQGVWGRGRMLRSNGLVRIVPSEEGSGDEPFANIAPGEVYQLTCSYRGGEDYLQSALESAVGYVADPAPPRFTRMSRSASGWRAEWSRAGIGYRLLHSDSPAGPWYELRESVLPEVEWSIPTDPGAGFYRIEAIR